MADQPKSFALSAELHEYMVSRGTPPDALQRELIEETAQLGGASIMQIAPEQGAFLTLLTRLIGARRAVEVGTFTGYSALCIARGLPEDGHLLCCDVSKEWTDVGRRYWQKDGIADHAVRSGRPPRSPGPRPIRNHPGLAGVGRKARFPGRGGRPHHPWQGEGAR